MRCRICNHSGVELHLNGCPVHVRCLPCKTYKTDSQQLSVKFFDLFLDNSIAAYKVTHRTGRWSIQEVTLVEELVRVFESGQLLIKNGMKLGSFLSKILHCKSSRLTKKFKNGNLSKTYLRKENRCLDDEEAYELSALLESFLVTQPNIRPVVQRAWSELFLEYCCDASENCDLSDDVQGGLFSIPLQQSREPKFHLVNAKDFIECLDMIDTFCVEENDTSDEDAPLKSSTATVGGQPTVLENFVGGIEDTIAPDNVRKRSHSLDLFLDADGGVATDERNSDIWLDAAKFLREENASPVAPSNFNSGVTVVSDDSDSFSYHVVPKSPYQSNGTVPVSKKVKLLHYEHSASIDTSYTSEVSVEGCKEVSVSDEDRKTNLDLLKLMGQYVPVEVNEHTQDLVNAFIKLRMLLLKSEFNCSPDELGTISTIRKSYVNHVNSSFVKGEQLAHLICREYICLTKYAF